MLKPRVSITDFAKELSQAKNTVVSKAVISAWNQQELEMCSELPKIVRHLAEATGRMIWCDGYKPFKNVHIEEQSDHYDANKDIGIFVDVVESKSYAQKLAPLVCLLDKMNNELQNIKSKWWYKLFTFFKRENNDA